jgi:two-component system response regulator HydG
MDRKKILIIDDEEDLCLLMKLNLESSGEFEVITAFSGQEAISKIKDIAFDLVITDYNMPDMNGEDVINQAKEMKPSLPILLFSVYHDDSFTLTSRIKNKADGIISKPIDHSQLNKVIHEVLNKDKDKGQNI